jgi:diguanylate cyclase (GGDEF)-like protein
MAVMTEAGGGPNPPHRILVVDDDPETARLVRTWYGGLPFEILEAPSGEDGLRLAAEHLPDLILLDVRMPGLDGVSVARRLQHDPVTCGIPVILLTACRDLETKVEAFAAGAHDYITKPFECEEIDARIRSTLQRRQALLRLQSEVRDLRTSNDQLEQLVMTDEKTGLFNFREFQRRLREEWNRAERYRTPLSIIFLDLDDFKALNDTMGHQAGDRALGEFATLVTGGARASDVAARYGGEEFAIVLPHTDGAMGVRVAERILAAVREFVFIEDLVPTRITVSAGVATYPADPEIDSMDALVRAADQALYWAKDAGKDCVVLHESRSNPDRSAAPRQSEPRDRRTRSELS